MKNVKYLFAELDKLVSNLRYEAQHNLCKIPAYPSIGEVLNQYREGKIKPRMRNGELRESAQYATLSNIFHLEPTPLRLAAERLCNEYLERLDRAAQEARIRIAAGNADDIIAIFTAIQQLR